MYQMNEPMLLGSPGSPHSPNTYGHSGYLPAYMATDTSFSSPAYNLWSPNVYGASKATNRSYAPSPHANQSFSLLSHSPKSTDLRNKEIFMPRVKEKTGAPPVASLMDEISTSLPFQDKRSTAQASYTPNSSFASQSLTRTPGAHGAGHQISLLSSAAKTPSSPPQMDPFYTQGESLNSNDRLDETWITVFGFPPASTSFILQQFSQYGTILKHVISADGNWMHIHYQSRMQATKALSKNGKVFGNSIMVGVTPCIDKGIMESNKENADNLSKSALFSTPVAKSMQLNESETRNTPIRPLTASYRASTLDHSVQAGGNTPQKSSGILHKAVEYVFGW